ncbi:MAG: S1 RNA-binding domain-containing protein [Chitinivibrionales bacterium]|nr:S1 RNA-binding domain-containing protein [Chitinivibrionales bacterium]
MIRFAYYISEQWDISEKLAARLCEAYESGTSPFYLIDYDSLTAVELEPDQIFEIYDFLEEIDLLSVKRKRALNAFAKENKLDEELEEHINYSISGYELDDLLAAHRLNPRSKAQLAVKNGLGPLADLVEKQEVEQGSLEEKAEEFVGAHSSFKTGDDVINGLKSILVERFGNDETTRAMVRDFTFDEGFFEVIPKKKKEKQYAAYVGKFVKISELTHEEMLSLMVAESAKDIRFKLNAQLFRVTELLRQHFITNPDAIGFDIMCEAIDECWMKALQPLVEKDIKARLRKEAEDKLLRQITKDVQKGLAEKKQSGSYLSLAIKDKRHLTMVAFDARGRLLGAAHARNAIQQNKSPFNTRLKQMFSRYRPAHVIIDADTDTELLESLIKKTLAESIELTEIRHQQCGKSTQGLAKSEWMMREFGDLDEHIRVVLAQGLLCIQPLNLISQIGLEHFAIHSQQHLITPDRLANVIQRELALIELHEGIPVSKAGDALPRIFQISTTAASDIQKMHAKSPLSAKLELSATKGITRPQFTSFVGYIIIPQGKYCLDRTLVHPDHFQWVEDLAEMLNISLEALINDPELLRSLPITEYDQKIYIEKRLIHQLSAGQKYLTPAFPVKTRRKKLAELSEGTVVNGKVTNVTQFGVFVDINAVCDGLIHISQLADTYVESAEQVVSVSDTINVRIVKVDPKKRRISLSMKNMGDLAPKIKPSHGQLSSLADHFKNR